MASQVPVVAFLATIEEAVEKQPQTESFECRWNRTPVHPVLDTSPPAPTPAQQGRGWLERLFARNQGAVEELPRISPSTVPVFHYKAEDAPTFNEEVHHTPPKEALPNY